MYSETIARLEKFDNEHEFERLCGEILMGLGYRDVTLIAPRGGSDGGMDITFATENGGRGLACVTLRKDIKVKFEEDFKKRQPGDFDRYMLFCTAYVTASMKREFALYCLERFCQNSGHSGKSSQKVGNAPFKTSGAWGKDTPRGAFLEGRWEKFSSIF